VYEDIFVILSPKNVVASIGASSRQHALSHADVLKRDRRQHSGKLFMLGDFMYIVNDDLQISQMGSSGLFS
jgi:hypothetical protein